MNVASLFKFFTSFFLLSFISTGLLANTGKFAGRVTEKGTGEPLPGVNVIVVGTTRGAATDLNGEFVILNVRPGNYSLKASFIGYGVVTVQNLRISTGNTTRQDFVLSPEAIAGEEIVIVAERPLVQKDLTSSQKVTTAEEIKELPVESFLGVLVTQSGVNQGASGEIHIRGGRSNEIGYYIDGVSVANPFFTNSLATNVSNKALEELKVISGAFNAEYGNAMSGIVNLQLKEGGARYNGSLTAYTGDYISNDSDIFINIDDRDVFANQVFEGNLTGPVPGFGSNFTFNISSRYSDNEGYMYGVREHLPGDSANFAGDFWYVEQNGDNVFVPMNSRTDLNFLTKLTYKLAPNLKLSGQLLYDRGRWRAYNASTHPYNFNPDGTTRLRDDNYNYSLKLNHAFSRSFYEASFFYSTTDFRQFAFEDENDPRYVPTTRIIGEATSPYFVFGGTQMGRNFRESSSLGFKLDYTNQINARHEIKTGIDIRKDNLQERNVVVRFDNIQFDQPTVLPENESPSHSFYDNDITFVSGYLQDKIEYQNFIVNAGVRYDRYDPNAEYFTDLLDPDSNEPNKRTKAEIKQRLSPRLGVSFPITDRGILHFSYGHFYQMPTLRRLYQVSVFGAGNAPTVGFSNLKPQKTVNYEFGLQQQFGDKIAVELAVFQKDIRDLLARQDIRYDSREFGPSSYRVYLNKDYGSIKGFTFSLTKRYDPATKFSAWLDYTFQTTEGNDVRAGAFRFSEFSGLEEEKAIVPLNWDQRHVINATVTISEPNNWGVSFIGAVSSGWPHTPNIPFANYVPEANSGRKPWQQNLNLHAYKHIDLNKLRFTVFTKIFNVFDRRNERFVFNDTGSANYTFVNRTTQETPELISHYGEPGIHEWSEYQVRPYWYSAPRSVQAGMTLEF
ncbi:MAG: TonB-dependent receptor domain-containing protein [bacterium]